MQKEHLEAALEEINRKLQLLIDGHATLIRRFDVVDARLDAINNRLGRIENRVARVASPIGRISR